MKKRFAALGAGTRREILGQLMDGEMRLSDLTDPFEMTQTAVSKHVRVLSDAGLIHVEKCGRTRYCRLDAARLKAASDWLGEYEEFWSQQTTNPGRFLSDEEQR
jgi:DNA-binding transcriptional ArsR family regulator